MTRVERLEAARDALARAIPEADGQRLPALVREYRAVLTELDELGAAPAKPKGSRSVDDIAAARAARLAKAKGSNSA